MTLHDDRVLDVVPEPWWNGPTVVMTTIFPTVIIQQQVNSLSTRHIQPRGPHAFDFVWTHFGFADDPPDMQRSSYRHHAVSKTRTGAIGFRCVKDEVKN